MNKTMTSKPSDCSCQTHDSPRTGTLRFPAHAHIFTHTHTHALSDIRQCQMRRHMSAKTPVCRKKRTRSTCALCYAYSLTVGHASPCVGLFCMPIFMCIFFFDMHALSVYSPLWGYIQVQAPCIVRFIVKKRALFV